MKYLLTSLLLLAIASCETSTVNPRNGIVDYQNRPTCSDTAFDAAVLDSIWVNTDGTLSVSWTNNCGQVLQIHVNDTVYQDGNSKYTLWTTSTTAIAMPCNGNTMKNSNPGDNKTVFIETFGNVDTTGAQRKYSNIKSLLLPGSYTCGLPVTKHGNQASSRLGKK